VIYEEFKGTGNLELYSQEDGRKPQLPPSNYPLRKRVEKELLSDNSVTGDSSHASYVLEVL